MSISVYIPTFKQFTLIDKSGTKRSRRTKLIRSFCRNARYGVRIIVVKMLIKPQTQIVLFIIDQFSACQPSHNIQLSQYRLRLLHIQFCLHREIIIRLPVIRIKTISIFYIQFGGKPDTLIKDFIFQFKRTHSHRNIHTNIGHTKLLARC